MKNLMIAAMRRYQDAEACLEATIDRKMRAGAVPSRRMDVHRRTRVMTVRWPVLLLVAVCATGARADTPAPPASSQPISLMERAVRRFPQPVRVGDLIGRQVLQPIPAQHVLGRVAAVERNDQGGIDVLVRFGGFFGWGTRLIAVPVEAMALLGEHVVVMDFTPPQLRAFTTSVLRNEARIPFDDTIRIGLTKPFH